LSTNQQLPLYTLTHIVNQSVDSSVHIDTYCQPINGFVCTHCHTLSTNQRLHYILSV